MRRIVCDTGPVIHLREANALPLLNLTGEVHIPERVDRELARHGDDWNHEKPGWIHVQILNPPHRVQARAWVQGGLLDEGEAESIALCQQLRSDWLLTDDAAARLFAESLGLEVHGSLGVVLWVAAVGRLDQAKAEAALDRLSKSSLWISPQVLAEAKGALNDLFSR